jgi:hypothetical protein
MTMVSYAHASLSGTGYYDLLNCQKCHLHYERPKQLIRYLYRLDQTDARLATVLDHNRWAGLRLRRRLCHRFRNTERVYHPKNDGGTLRVGLGPVFMFVFEEDVPIFSEIDVVGLQADGMNVIEGDELFKRIHYYIAAGVTRDLRLIVPKSTQPVPPWLCSLSSKTVCSMESLAPPLIGKCRPWVNLDVDRQRSEHRAYVRTTSGFRSVDLPISHEVCSCPRVLGQVKGATSREVVTPIARTDIIRDAGSVAAGWRHKGIRRPDISPRQVPAQSRWLEPRIRKTKPSSSNGDAISEKRQRERACGYCGKCNHRRELGSENLELGNIKENVFHCPDVIRACGVDWVAVRKIQPPGTVI